MELIEKVTQLGEMYAIDFIGVAGISNYKDEIENTGGLLVGNYPRALSIGIVLPKSIVALLNDRNTYENVLQYKIHAYDIINSRLDNFSSIVSSIIQKDGYDVMPTPAAERIDSKRICASISHKITARLAGFGWIGKNCLLITPTHGPGVRWTTIFTNAPFQENHTLLENRCGTCNRCVKACPAQAIKGRGFIEQESREMRLDVSKCENYFKELGRLNKLEICGMCIYACPYGKIDVRKKVI
jgi:epoxyqueuosine reductase